MMLTNEGEEKVLLTSFDLKVETFLVLVKVFKGRKPVQVTACPADGSVVFEGYGLRLQVPAKPSDSETFSIVFSTEWSRAAADLKKWATNDELLRLEVRSLKVVEVMVIAEKAAFALPAGD